MVMRQMSVYIKLTGDWCRTKEAIRALCSNQVYEKSFTGNACSSSSTLDAGGKGKLII